MPTIITEGYFYSKAKERYERFLLFRPYSPTKERFLLPEEVQAGWLFRNGRFIEIRLLKTQLSLSADVSIHSGITVWTTWPDVSLNLSSFVDTTTGENFEIKHNRLNTSMDVSIHSTPSLIAVWPDIHIILDSPLSTAVDDQRTIVHNRLNLAAGVPITSQIALAIEWYDVEINLNSPVGVGCINNFAKTENKINQGFDVNIGAGVGLAIEWHDVEIYLDAPVGVACSSGFAISENKINQSFNVDIDTGVAIAAEFPNDVDISLDSTITPAVVRKITLTPVPRIAQQFGVPIASSRSLTVEPLSDVQIVETSIVSTGTVRKVTLTPIPKVGLSVTVNIASSHAASLVPLPDVSIVETSTVSAGAVRKITLASIPKIGLSATVNIASSQAIVLVPLSNVSIAESSAVAASAARKVTLASIPKILRSYTSAISSVENVTLEPFAAVNIVESSAVNTAATRKTSLLPTINLKRSYTVAIGSTEQVLLEPMSGLQITLSSAVSTSYARRFIMGSVIVPTSISFTHPSYLKSHLTWVNRSSDHQVLLKYEQDMGSGGSDWDEFWNVTLPAGSTQHTVDYSAWMHGNRVRVKLSYVGLPAESPWYTVHLNKTQPTLASLSAVASGNLQTRFTWTNQDTSSSIYIRTDVNYSGFWYDERYDLRSAGSTLFTINWGSSYAGRQVRFMGWYTNWNVYSPLSNIVMILSSPSTPPNSLSLSTPWGTDGYPGMTITAAWNNTNNTASIEVEFQFLAFSGDPAWSVYQTITRPVGSTSGSITGSHMGRYRFRARYFSSLGTGNWSSYSNEVYLY